MQTKNIQNLNQLKAHVTNIIDTSEYMSDALSMTGDMVKEYFHGEHTRLIDSGIVSDNEQVLFALKQDLQDYTSSFLRGYSSNTKRIQTIAQKIDQVQADDARGYDMFDTSEDADQCFVIDTDYIMEVIDYCDSYYRFMHSFHE